MESLRLFRVCIAAGAIAAFAGAAADVSRNADLSVRLFLGVLADSNPGIDPSSSDVSVRADETLDIERYWSPKTSTEWGVRLHQSTIAPDSTADHPRFVLRPAISLAGEFPDVSLGGVLSYSQTRVTRLVSDAASAEFDVSWHRTVDGWPHWWVVGRIPWERFYDREEGFENTPLDLSGDYFSPKIEARWYSGKGGGVEKLFHRPWYAESVIFGAQYRRDKPSGSEFDFRGYGVYLDATVPLKSSPGSQTCGDPDRWVTLRINGNVTWGDYLKPSQFDPTLAVDRSDSFGRLGASVSMPVRILGEIVVGVDYALERSDLAEYHYRQLTGTIGWRLVWGRKKKMDRDGATIMTEDAGSVTTVSDSGPTKPRVKPPAESRRVLLQSPL